MVVSRSSVPLGGQLDLDTLDPSFLILALLLGKIEVPKEFKHALVLAHHQRVEASNPFVFGFVDQLTRQGYSYTVILPAISTRAAYSAFSCSLCSRS